MNRSYELGLTEITDDTFAWLQPDGGWGWSNAGLVVGDGASLLVDTLFDLKLTRAMLDGMAQMTAERPIGTLVNTHANGDHTFGNQLLAGAEIVATAACAEEFSDVPAEALGAMVVADYGDPVVTEFLQRAFGPFDFGGITMTPPTRTFSDQLSLSVGGRTVELLEVGPAHTDGDLLAYVPDAKTVFTGDILFVYGTPIVWAGPFSNWTAACDRILDLDVEHVVPGHGPVTDKEGARMVKAYLEFVHREASQRHAAGMSPADATRDIDLGEFADWGDSERLVVNVQSVYSELDPSYELPAIDQLLAGMAHYALR
ncbi:MAG: MBL fold metallo-hydrolase [Acidimicrobiia bacterium]|nr:MBL fold metallo-hydrolase [Acidimicrobiia bacterium]